MFWKYMFVVPSHGFLIVSDSRWSVPVRLFFFILLSAAARGHRDSCLERLSRRVRPRNIYVVTFVFSFVWARLASLLFLLSGVM